MAKFIAKGLEIDKNYNVVTAFIPGWTVDDLDDHVLVYNDIKIRPPSQVVLLSSDDAFCTLKVRGLCGYDPPPLIAVKEGDVLDLELVNN